MPTEPHKCPPLYAKCSCGKDLIAEAERRGYERAKEEMLKFVIKNKSNFEMSFGNEFQFGWEDAHYYIQEHINSLSPSTKSGEEE